MSNNIGDERNLSPVSKECFSIKSLLCRRVILSKPSRFFVSINYFFVTTFQVKTNIYQCCISSSTRKIYFWNPKSRRRFLIFIENFGYLLRDFFITILILGIILKSSRTGLIFRGTTAQLSQLQNINILKRILDFFFVF